MEKNPCTEGNNGLVFFNNFIAKMGKNLNDEKIKIRLNVPALTR